MAPVLRSRSVPTTTKVDSVKHFVLSQAMVRPERYGESACLETMPSSPLCSSLELKAAFLILSD
jgi:hypothetical protein